MKRHLRFNTSVEMTRHRTETQIILSFTIYISYISYDILSLLLNNNKNNGTCPTKTPVYVNSDCEVLRQHYLAIGYKNAHE